MMMDHQPAHAHRLYDDLAWVWPLLSPPGDYQGEAKGVHKLIRQQLGAVRKREAAPRTLLELGSGGGHLLFHLQAWYDVTASDLSEAMIRLSVKLNPNVTHIQADMRTLRLGQRYDAVVIHDALGYMQSSDEVAQALATAAAHLKPDGVLVLLPDELEQTFEDHQSAADSVTTPDGRSVTFVSHATRMKGQDRCLLTMLFLIQQDGKLSIVEDRHICGLFSGDQWREMLQQAGFEGIGIEVSPNWRQAPVMTARKPA
jgi:SAM-dependent methyltransferase